MSVQYSRDQYESELQLVKQVVDLIVSCQTVHDLCQRLVHDDFASGNVQGAHVYSITGTLDIVHETGYGKSTEKVEQSASTWDQDSLLAACIRSKAPTFKAGPSQAHLAMPLIRNAIPTACLLLVLKHTVQESPISDVSFDLLSKVGAFFVEATPNRGVKNGMRNSGVRSSDITPRQIQILNLAAQGLTNGAIGKIISISESTVRQETIKIYRSLEVEGRPAAIAKAKLSGLIQS